jgi:hypothetical protein
VKKSYIRILALLYVLIFSGCDLFNKPLMDYIAKQTGLVEVASYDFPAGANAPFESGDVVLIPPGAGAGPLVIVPGSKIMLRLKNGEDYRDIKLSLSGFPSGRTVTADQTDAGTVIITIENAQLGDEFNLVLTMKSPDELREFPAYTLPVIRCVSFDANFILDRAGPYDFNRGTTYIPGYIQPGALTVTVINRGNLDTGPLTVTSSDSAFSVLPGTLPSIAVGSTASFTVQPAAGLAGSYSSTITVSDGAGSQDFIVEFTVREPGTIVYVKSDGDDAKDGLSQTEAVQTIGRAIDCLPAAGGEIRILDNITLTGPAINITKDITLLADGANISITRGSAKTDALFTVDSGKTLTLGRTAGYTLTVDGNGSTAASAPLISTAGTLVMNNTVILQNNKNPSGSNRGGAVIIASLGTFTMNGGVIQANTASLGGGVYSYNGTFTMSGGSRIDPNNDVYLQSGTTIEIAGTLTATTPVATITPQTYNTAVIVLSESTAGLIAANYGKFAVTPEPGSSWGIDSTGKLRPYSLDDLTAAIDAIPAGGSGTITLPDATILLTGRLTINNNKTVTILPPASGTAILKRDSSYSGSYNDLFFVESDATLNLGNGTGNFVIDGGYPPLTAGSSGHLVDIRKGTVNMYDGVTLKNNYITAGSATTCYGGAVRVGYGGNHSSFIMHGGFIRDNYCKPTGSYSPGAVYVADGSSFTMNGGSITGNSGSTGGVALSSYSGQFTMNGGTINSNSALGPSPLFAGVYHPTGSTYTHVGGTVSDAVGP